MAKPGGRVRGLQGPFTPEQVSTFVLHPIATAAFFLLSETIVAAAPSAAAGMSVVLTHAAAAVSVLVNWFLVSWIDPSIYEPPTPSLKPGCLGAVKTSLGACTALCDRGGTERPYYCMHCGKRVPFFDHHCGWLNTCISRRNYKYFYLLAASGTVQYVTATATSVLLLTFWRFDPAGPLASALGESLAAGLIGVYLLLVAALAAAFGSLFGFHSYLRVLGLGTYDWIILQQHAEDDRYRKASLAEANKAGSAAAKALAAVEGRKAKEREAWQRRMHEKQMKQGGGSVTGSPAPTPPSVGSPGSKKDTFFADESEGATEVGGTHDVEMARNSEEEGTL